MDTMLETSEATQPKLPMELTDAILDQLHGDKRTLFNCSVVCSSWLQASRYHLFHTLRIDNAERSQLFSEFLTFIRNTPHIAVYIDSLSLQGNGNHYFRGIGPFLLSQILEELPSLRNLELDNVIWERALRFGENVEPILANWPRINKPLTSLFLRRLRSDGTYGRSCLVNDTIEAMSIFSSLRSLTLERITFSKIVEPPVEIGVPRICLEQLDIGAAAEPGIIPSRDYLDILKATLSTETLSKLNVRCHNRMHTEQVGHFVRELNLSDLSLDLSHMDQLATVGNQSIWSSLGLASLNSLKSVTLHVWTSGTHLYGDVFTFVGQWCICSVLPILSHISPTVQRVTVILSVSGDPSHLRGHLEQFDWQRLQNEFNRLTALESIVFEIRQRLNVNVGDEATAVVMSLIENKLSTLVASGILEVMGG